VLTLSDVTVHDKNLSGFNGTAWHIEADGKHYAVSATVVPYSGPETMVFAANEKGKVVDWTDLAVVHSLNHEAAIEALLSELKG
jgi:hypothetical protein